MRLCRFSVAGEGKLGAVVDDLVIDLPASWGLLGEQRRRELKALGDDMRAFLHAGDMAMAAAGEVTRLARQSLSSGRQPEGPRGKRIAYALGEVRLLAPVPNPPKLIIIGLNYRDHAQETGTALPALPKAVGKLPNTITGPHDPIVLPRAAAEQVDYEAELAFIIGKRAKKVPLEKAYDHIAGYMAFNDVTARDLQIAQGQLLLGKSPDTFAPTGPWIVTREEVPDPHNLTVRCLVNGRLLQDSNTRNLIFNVPYLLYYLSQTITLEPGDIISTGTPSGTGFSRKPPVLLRPGDVVRVEIGGVGALENPVRMEG